MRKWQVWAVMVLVSAGAAAGWWIGPAAANMAMRIADDLWLAFGSSEEFRMMRDSGSGDLRWLGDEDAVLMSLTPGGLLSAVEIDGAFDGASIGDLEDVASPGSGDDGRALAWNDGAEEAQWVAFPSGVPDGTEDGHSLLWDDGAWTAGVLNDALLQVIGGSGTETLENTFSALGMTVQGLNDTINLLEVEALGTSGAAGTAPLSDGAGGLTMSAVLTPSSGIGDLGDVLAPGPGDDAKVAFYNHSESRVEWGLAQPKLPDGDVAGEVLRWNAGSSQYEPGLINGAALDVEPLLGVPGVGTLQDFMQAILGALGSELNDVRWPQDLASAGLTGVSSSLQVFEDSGDVDDRVGWRVHTFGDSGAPTGGAPLRLPITFAGQPLRFTVVWSSTESMPSPAESVRWRVMGGRVVDAALGGGPSLAVDESVTTAYLGPGSVHASVMDSGGVSWEAGDWVSVNLRRDTGHGDDDFIGDAEVLFVLVAPVP